MGLNIYAEDKELLREMDARAPRSNGISAEVLAVKF